MCYSVILQVLLINRLIRHIVTYNKFSSLTNSSNLCKENSGNDIGNLLLFLFDEKPKVLDLFQRRYLRSLTVCIYNFTLDSSSFFSRMCVVDCQVERWKIKYWLNMIVYFPVLMLLFY
jgi:hypothetical protein